MDNSLSKVNQIHHLADSVSHDKNPSKFKEKNGNDSFGICILFLAGMKNF